MPAFDYGALKHAFGGHYIANNGYTKARAETALSDGHADLVSFGYPFIANPDLAERLRHDRPLAHADMSMAYGGGEAGSPTTRRSAHERGPEQPLNTAADRRRPSNKDSP